jgi:Ca2+-binding EF-hand superfamily protein
MFAFYDRSCKGYIDLDDMRKVLAEVCSEKEILELFEDSDRDGDGRLSLLEFANVILPMDLEIEGLQ